MLPPSTYNVESASAQLILMRRKNGFRKTNKKYSADEDQVVVGQKKKLVDDSFGIDGRFLNCHYC